MKKIGLILLLLSGCGTQDTEGRAAADEVAASEQVLPDALLDPIGGLDPAQLEALVAGAVSAALPGAEQLQYRNIRPGAAGTACGEVAVAGARGAPGPFMPFVVNRVGVATIATTPAIAYDDPTDPFAQAWIRWCAPVEELQALAKRPPIEDPEAFGPLATQAPTLPFDLEPALPPAAQQPSAAAEAPDRSPQAPQIDSFSNSVVRREP